MKIIKTKIFKIVVSFICLIISYLLTEEYLKNNFEDLGESYRKGFGGILWENLEKGLFFIFTREFLTFFFLSSIIYFILGTIGRLFFKKVIFPIWIFILFLVTTYVGMKVYDTYFGDYGNRNNRLLEIFVMWYTRALGFLVCYKIITKYKLSEKVK